MKVIIGEEKVEMTYEEICHKLGYRPETGFIDVTEKGAIGFTAAKPDEILPLLSAVTREKMCPSYSLLKYGGYKNYAEYKRLVAQWEEEDADFMRRYGM